MRATRALFGLGLLAAIVLGFGGLRPGLAAAAPADRTPRGPVVVVGVPGLRWDQVSPDATPALAALVARGAVGSLSIRAGSGITCAADGWLTLGAGNRATGPSHPGAGCPPDLPTGPVVAQAGGGATVAGFPALVATNRRLPAAVELGALGAQVRASGGCTAAIGPGAALAAADPRGRIDRYVDHLPPDAPNLADALGQCALTVVALPPAQSAVPDAEIAAVDAARPTGSLLVVVGLAESGSQPRLHVAAAVGPGMGAGYLTSASTRRPPYVQLVDGAPTVLAQLGLPAPAGAIGQPWRSVEGRPAGTPATVAALVDTDRAAQAQRRVVGPFFFGLELAQAIVFGLAAWRLRRRPADRASTLRWLHRVAVAATAVPVGTFLANLVPWWRAGLPALALVGSVVVATAALSAGALLGPWRRRLLGPAGAVATITAGVIALDLVTGARLQISSLAGYSPLVAGRFAGIGNAAYGVFAPAVLLAGAALAGAAVAGAAQTGAAHARTAHARTAAAGTALAGRSRQVALAITAVLGLVAIVVDGSPAWGSDVGGVLALMPGVAVLVLGCAGYRVSWSRLAAAGAAGVAVVAGFAVADYQRPVPARTHLGRFVDQLLHGGAGAVIRRKAQANAELLLHSVWSPFVPLLVLLAAAIVLRPDRMGAGGLARAYDRAPTLRVGLLAVLVTAVVGFAVNDSGIAVPSLAIVFGVPFVVAVTAHVAGPFGGSD